MVVKGDAKMKMIEKLVERKVSHVIIVADANSVMDSIDTYSIFINIVNGITNYKYKLYCDFKNDYYEINLKNISDTLIKIDQITEKLKDKSLILVSGGIKNELWNYYEKVEPYFNLMARSAGKFVDISPYIEPIYKLYKQNYYDTL